MYAASENYESLINGYSRHFQARLKKDGETVNAEIKQHTVRKYSSTGEDITIGSAFASSVEISCITESALKDSEVTLETGLEISSGEYEYIPDGVYTITSQGKNEEITTLVGYDKMYINGNQIFNRLTAPSPYLKTASELAAQLGVTFDQTCLEGVDPPDVSPSDETYTLVEMAGYLAGLIGRNAFIDRSGCLTFQAAYTDSGYVFDGNRISNIIIDQTARVINGLECTAEEETLSAGPGIGVVKMENPFMTQIQLDALADQIVGFVYYGAEVAFLLGDPRLDPWDLICYKPSDEAAEWVPILCHDICFNFDGGLSMEIISYAQSQTDIETGFKGPLQTAVDKAQQAANQVKKEISRLDAQEIFNRLTNNGALQGLFKDSDTGDIMINAAYIAAGILASLGGESWIDLEDGTFSLLNDAIKGDAQGVVADSLVFRDGLYVQQKYEDEDTGEVSYNTEKYPFLLAYLTNRAGGITLNPGGLFDLVQIEGLVEFPDIVSVGDIQVMQDWTPLTLNNGFSQGNYEREELAWKKIGNHVYISGSVVLDDAFTGKMTVATLPSKCAPTRSNYRIVAGSGARIARIFVSPSGALELEWIRKLSDGSNDTTTTGLWVSMTMDYWID